MVAHISPGYDVYLNLDKEIITRAFIVDAESYLKMTQDSLDRACLSYQWDRFKVNNALVYHILSMVFADTDACVNVKQRKSTQNGREVYIDIQKHLLGPNHAARQVADAVKMLQISYYDGEWKDWNWEKYVALYKE